MSELFDVVVMDVKGVVSYRDTKYCVCVSNLQNKYLFINTDHRTMYDDFEIKAEDYIFLNNKNNG